MTNGSAARCPFCDSTELRPSGLRYEKDSIHLIFLMRPIRCLQCGERFYSWVWKRIKAQ
jgi:hypothetical protein